MLESNMGRSNTSEPQYERRGRGEEGERNGGEELETLTELGTLEFVPLMVYSEIHLFCDKMVKTLQSVSSERGREVVI